MFRFTFTGNTSSLIFDNVNNSNGTISFRAHANNMIVTADNAGASPLIANRTAIGTWEQFTLITDS